MLRLAVNHKDPHVEHPTGKGRLGKPLFHVYSMSRQPIN